jgi:hypothetical protein
LADVEQLPVTGGGVVVPPGTAEAAAAGDLPPLLTAYRYT